jgi:hypothetical protein
MATKTKKSSKKSAKVAKKNVITKKPKLIKGSTEQWNGIGGPPIAKTPKITGDKTISKVQRIDGDFALWMIEQSKEHRTNVTTISRMVHAKFITGEAKL